MTRIEQADKCEVNISPKNPFSLKLKGKKHNEQIAIVDPERSLSDQPKVIRDLWRTVALSHLVSAYFPRIIETNFPVNYTDLVNALYDYYGYRPPKISANSNRLNLEFHANESKLNDGAYIVNSHSGGLDSCFRLASHLARGEMVRAVHLRNLNRVLPGDEAERSSYQCKQWNVPFTEVKVINSSELKGLDVMRVRDLLVAATVVLTAYRYGIKEVLVEGGFVDSPDEGDFSESKGAWNLFNNLLSDAGLDINVTGEYPGDIETVGEILNLEKKLNITILPLVQNCFTRKCWAANNRRKWERKTPELAKACLSENTCGSCPKCRRTVLGRIYYEDTRLSGVPSEEISYFIKDTKQWIKRYGHNTVSTSFHSHLSDLDHRYGVLFG